MIIKCNNCKEEVDVSMYFYDEKIIKYETVDVETYKAVVEGKAICPCCGMEINKHFSSDIYKTDILKLATRRETKI